MTNSILLERKFGSVNTASLEALAKRRVYILPTKYGFLFGCMLLVMLLGAINYDNNLAYSLTFLLSSLVLVAIFFTYRNIAGLIVTLHKPQPVFAGQDACFPLQVDNTEQLQRLSLSFQLKQTPKYWFIAAKSQGAVNFSDIDANQIQFINVKKPAKTRGRLDFGRLQISTTFPLGLFTAWSNCDFDQTCIVYPAPDGSLPFPRDSFKDTGNTSQSKQGNDDFIGVRKYRSGDSSRHIDWKAYAREKGLHRKLFQGQGNTELIFHWQDVAHLNDIELCLSQLCQWIIEAERSNISYGLQIGSTEIPPANGLAHQQRCLTSLALYGLT